MTGAPAASVSPAPSAIAAYRAATQASDAAHAAWVAAIAARDLAGAVEANGRYLAAMDARRLAFQGLGPRAARVAHDAMLTDEERAGRERYAERFRADDDAAQAFGRAASLPRDAK